MLRRYVLLCGSLILILCTCNIRLNRVHAQTAQLDFTFPGEMRSGDCHVLPGSHLTVTPSTNGKAYHLEFKAQMKTDRSISGDTWHMIWHFKNAGGVEVLVSPQEDLPDGAAMHPQYGNYNVDHTEDFGGGSAVDVINMINSITDVQGWSSC